EYSIEIGNLTGVFHAYTTKKRFYAIVSMNTRKDEAVQQKFLSSFELPDKPVETRTASTPPTSETNPDAQVSEARTDNKKPENGEKKPELVTDQPGEGSGGSGEIGQPTTQPKEKRGPINGGVLNGKAIYLPMPEVPAGEVAGV